LRIAKEGHAPPDETGELERLSDCMYEKRKGAR
jgi:hypothetical protein